MSKTITKRIKSEKRFGCPNTYGTPMLSSGDDKITAYAVVVHEVMIEIDGRA
jgi:hypothetical protein